MKTHKALWKLLCWTGVVILFNAAVATCFSYEPKVENEPEETDSLTVEAQIDSVAMPIFKQDSLGTVPGDSSAVIPTGLTFSDSAMADTLYARKEEKPFYKKRWFIAVVVGVVAATIIAIASGGEDEDKDDLPEFPDPPDK